MRNAHAIAKHNMSFKSYEVLCRLDRCWHTLSNRQTAASMCSSITDVCRNGVVSDLSDCQYCSLTCDGSTDFMGEELETLYARLSYQDCRISDKFMYIGTALSGRSGHFKLHKGSLQDVGHRGNHAEKACWILCR